MAQAFWPAAAAAAAIQTQVSPSKNTLGYNFILRTIWFLARTNPLDGKWNQMYGNGNTASAHTDSDTRTIRGWLKTTALNKLVTYLLGKINTFLSEQSALSQVSHTNNTFPWHIVMGWWKFNAKPFECGGCKQK